MPTMQKLLEAYKDRGVVILGVNTWKKNADAAKDCIATKKFTYGCLLNGDDLAKAYGVTGIPTLVIIGKNGTVAMAEIGLSDDSGASLNHLAALSFAVAPPPSPAPASPRPRPNGSGPAASP